MQVDLNTLERQVRDTAAKSDFADRIEDIRLEADRDDEGSAFLRVVLRVKDIDKIADADFAALLEAIENSVGAIDERYPSVRFSDA